MLFYENLQEFIRGEKEKLDRLANHDVPERGIILKVLIPGPNQDKGANIANYSITHESEELEVDYLGIVGDRHRRSHGPTTPRERAIYPRGTEIKEHRHLLAVSPYDYEVLTELMGVDITPELLGANLVIGREDGKPYSLSHLPKNIYLLISERNATEVPKPPIATLINYVQQQGCGITSKAIGEAYCDKNLISKFVESSKNNRGIICSVEYLVESKAIIKPGQKVFFIFPKGVTT